jgi:glutathione synthase/RimK-type ligase-like ATP-grasp enzyme
MELFEEDMSNKNKKLVFHLVTSKVFWCGAPMIISEVIRRGYYISVFDENTLPPYKKLLDCHVYVDMSTITSKSFYHSLEKEYKRRTLLGLNTPLMIDPPESAVNSFDKRKTHKTFSDLIPESYNLTGSNNEQIINKFKSDEFIVIKTPMGWWGKDVERMTPQQAIKKYRKSKDMIVQKYIPFTRGVGRIVTFNHGADFEIACSYLRIPDSWRTGVDVEYKCIQQLVSDELYNFARTVSQRCGLYLNGIDYLYDKSKYVLLEVNAVPAIREPYEEFQIDIPKKLLDHIERNVNNKSNLRV